MSSQRLPIPHEAYERERFEEETFGGMMQRLDSEMRDRAALARRLGVSRRQVYRILEKYGLSEYRQ